MTRNREDYIAQLESKMKEVRIALKDACSKVDTEDVDIDLVRDIKMYAQRIEYFNSMIIDLKEN